MSKSERKRKSRSELKDLVKQWRLVSERLANQLHEIDTESSSKIINFQRKMLDFESNLKESEKYRIRLFNLVQEEVAELQFELNRLTKSVGENVANSITLKDLGLCVCSDISRIQLKLSIFASRATECDFCLTSENKKSNPEIQIDLGVTR